MIKVLLDMVAIILIVYFASGAWSGVGRRPRALTERDYQKAEAWRAECDSAEPDEDPLLLSLDIALTDGQDYCRIMNEELLPFEDKKA